MSESEGARRQGHPGAAFADGRQEGIAPRPTFTHQRLPCPASDPEHKVIMQRVKKVHRRRGKYISLAAFFRDLRRAAAGEEIEEGSKG